MIDLNWYLDFLFRHARIILGMAGICLATAFFILSFTVPEYTAFSQILLDPKRQNLLGPEAISPTSELLLDAASVDGQIMIIKSRFLLTRVAEEMRLAYEPGFGIEPQPSLLSQIKTQILRTKSSDDGDIVGSVNTVADQKEQLERGLLRAVGVLQGHLSVARVGRANVLEIKYSSPNKLMSAEIANALAKFYIADQLESRHQAAQRASEWLADLIVRLGNELRASEVKVARFRAEHNMVSAVTGAAGEQQLSELNVKLVAARTESAEKKAKYEQAQRIVAEGGNLQSIPDVMRSGVISALRGARSEISRREADLVAKYGESHPAVVNVQAELRDNEREIRAEISRIITNLKNDYDVAKAREASLEQSLGVGGVDGTDNAVAMRLRELERIVSTNKTLYDLYLTRAKISDEQANFEVPQARIIAQAITPGSPSYPSKSRFASLGLILGLVGGIGAAFLSETLRSGFISPQDVERVLEMPVLASVPALTKKDLQIGGSLRIPHIYLAKKPLSLFGEEIRTLRANIQMCDADDLPRVIQVTSVVQGEGKTAIALSIAQSAATNYPRVLFVDCDLRRSGATKMFGLAGKPGLVDLLAGSISLEGAINSAAGSAFFIIGNGASTFNPPDLLSSGRMESLLRHLKSTFDYIVLDSPTIGPVIDATVLAKFCDKVVFVTRWNKTPRDIVARAMKQLRQEKKVAGIVLNKIDIKLSSRYSGYYYTKYYGANSKDPLTNMLRRMSRL